MKCLVCANLLKGNDTLLRELRDGRHRYLGSCASEENRVNSRENKKYTYKKVNVIIVYDVVQLCEIFT